MRSINNVGVYVDSNTCQYHFDTLKYKNLHFTNLFVEPENFYSFIDSNLPTKIAVFHVPFTSDTEWLDRLNHGIQFVDKIIIFCSELHQHTVARLIELDKPNIIIFACGFINHNFQYATVYLWMDWFETTVYFYNTVQPRLLQEKLSFQPKSKYFDILLGCRRYHRDYIYNFINDAQLNDKVIMTYYQRWNVDLRNTDHIFETEGLEFLPESSYTHSVHHVLYYGHKMNLSQVVPFVIYNDSYYSLVAETNAVNQWNFYTEKIVKPILARRLFIVIAGQGYLRNLRKLGFKTFADIIDESYDDEPDDLKRWAMALNQVKMLTDQNAEWIQSSIAAIVDHNQNLMLSCNWYDDMINQLIASIAHTIDR